MEEIKIRDEFIKLGQLLKLADMVHDVELVGGVVDGGRDIEFLLVHWCFPLFCPRRMKAGRNYLQSTTERAVFARFYRIFPQKKKARRHKHRTFSI